MGHQQHMIRVYAHLMARLTTRPVDDASQMRQGVQGSGSGSSQSSDGMTMGEGVGSVVTRSLTIGAAPPEARGKPACCRLGWVGLG